MKKLLLVLPLIALGLAGCGSISATVKSNPTVLTNIEGCVNDLLQSGQTDPQALLTEANTDPLCQGAVSEAVALVIPMLPQKAP